MFVTPTPGLKIRDPHTRVFLPEAGAEVPETVYWLRRLRDGSVAQATPLAEAAAETPTPAAASEPKPA